MTTTKHRRVKPGMGGAGKFYRIEVRPKSDFVTFRNHDVGRKGGIERLAGKRGSGSWDDVTWLISKNMAHRVGRYLVADSAAAKKVIDTLGSKPVHVAGDRFKAKPRYNVPERLKPTLAMRRAEKANIKKAQAAVRAKRPRAKKKR